MPVSCGGGDSKASIMRSNAVHLRRSLSCQEEGVTGSWPCGADRPSTASDSTPDRQVPKNSKSSSAGKRFQMARITSLPSAELMSPAALSKDRSNRRKESVCVDVLVKTPQTKEESKEHNQDNRQEEHGRLEMFSSTACHPVGGDVTEHDISTEGWCRSKLIEHQDLHVNSSSVENLVTSEAVQTSEESAEDYAILPNISTENVVLMTKVARGACKIVIPPASEISPQRIPHSGTDQTDPSAEITHPLTEPTDSVSYVVLSRQEVVKDNCLTISKVRGRQKNRLQRIGRKWKPISEDRGLQLDFRMSLFPRNPVPNDDLEDEEISKEFEELQQSKQCLEVTESQTSTDCKPGPSNEKQEVTGKSENDESTNSVFLEFCLQEMCSEEAKDEDLSDGDYYDPTSFYHLKIPRWSSSFLTNEPYLDGSQRLRVKKKWKRTKAHLQIKTKHCRSVGNSVHGQLFYVHFRVAQRMTMEIIQRTFNQHYNSLSLKRIDNSRGLTTEGLKILGKLTPQTAEPNGRKPRAPPGGAQSRFAMDAFNADGELSADLVNILVNLQHRDLLPEDYDLLLRLDERVAAKTVDCAVLSALKTEVVSADGEGRSDPCAVCMERYEPGQTVKYLPCGHCYHDACIDRWLANSSQNCPLDGVPIGPQ